MSPTTQTGQVPPARNSNPAANPHPELIVYAHSPLLFWWPIWAVGFVMAFWTYLDDHHMILVPGDTVVERGQINLPADGTILATKIHISRSRIPGLIFVLTLLAVIVCSHTWLRGVWSLLIAACLTAILFLIGWLDAWEPLYRWFNLVHIYLNLGAYLVISTILLIVWTLTVFVFDRRVYMVFSLSQVRLHDELGGEEKVFDTGGVTFEKRPYDWFRWLVGLGAGDMIIRTSGTNAQTIELPNVVRVGRWLRVMERRLRTRDVE